MTGHVATVIAALFVFLAAGGAAELRTVRVKITNQSRMRAADLADLLDVANRIWARNGVSIEPGTGPGASRGRPLRRPQPGAAGFVGPGTGHDAVRGRACPSVHQPVAGRGRSVRGRLRGRCRPVPVATARAAGCGLDPDAGRRARARARALFAGHERARLHRIAATLVQRARAHAPRAQAARTHAAAGATAPRLLKGFLPRLLPERGRRT